MSKRTVSSKSGRARTGSKATATKPAVRPRAKAKPVAKTTATKATASKATASKARKSGQSAQSRHARGTTAPTVATAAPTRKRVARSQSRAMAQPLAAAGEGSGSKGVPVHVITVADLSSGNPGSSPGSAEFAYRILAEGDSWFTLGGIPSSNLLYEMRLPQAGIVCNIAYPGDTLKHIAELADNDDLRKLLTDRFGYRWHAILLSAGGNDLVDRAPLLLRNPGNGSGDPRDYLVSEQIERLVLDIQSGLRTIVGLRDGPASVNHDVPIVVHGYDYPTARNAPARFLAVPLLGPWLCRAYDALAIGADVHVPITDFLVNVLAEGIKVMAVGSAAALPHLHFVETRNALQRAEATSAGTSGDWLNEIHPSHTGYRKIADRISATLAVLLGG